MYTEQELVRIAKRENNSKRSYLVVNRLQGKHIPVSPCQALEMFCTLGEQLYNRCKGERLLIVGFAETATAIGAAIAVKLDTYYMHTTREDVPEAEYLYFTESHSHATEQRLIGNDLEKVIDKTDRIVFAEDEITTGNTILKIVDIIEKKFPRKVKFSAASIINGMDRQSLEIYSSRGIDLCYLLKTDHKDYAQAAQRFKGDGRYVQKNTDKPKIDVHNFHAADGLSPARRIIKGSRYQELADGIFRHIRNTVSFDRDDKILVIGTEEFMYPALAVGKRLEQEGFYVRSHSTTRSPIAVSSEEDYPLHTRYELLSLYDERRTTYIYDLKSFDKVLIITDGEPCGKGADSLVNALISAGNRNIYIF